MRACLETLEGVCLSNASEENCIKLASEQTEGDFIFPETFQRFNNKPAKSTRQNLPPFFSVNNSGQGCSFWTPVHVEQGPELTSLPPAGVGYHGRNSDRHRPPNSETTKNFKEKGDPWQTCVRNEETHGFFNTRQPPETWDTPCPLPTQCPYTLFFVLIFEGGMPDLAAFIALKWGWKVKAPQEIRTSDSTYHPGLWFRHFILGNWGVLEAFSWETGIYHMVKYIYIIDIRNSDSIFNFRFFEYKYIMSMSSQATWRRDLSWHTPLSRLRTWRMQHKKIKIAWIFRRVFVQVMSVWCFIFVDFHLSRC